MQIIKKIKLCSNAYWDIDMEVVIVEGNILSITRRMQLCLRYLIQFRGHPVQGSDIFNAVWQSYEKEFKAKAIRNLISELRKKIPCILISNYYGGIYMLQKYREPTPDLKDYLFDILDQAKNGITITDPNQEDNPVIYTNEAFVNTFGYSIEEVLGKNPRYLQNNDRDQPGLEEIKEAIERKKDITVVLRNYHKNGKLIYNEVSLSPIFDNETMKLKYFLGIQKDVSELYK